MQCIVYDLKRQRQQMAVFCIFAILTVLQFWVISMFSAQPAKVSTEVSNKIVDKVGLVIKSMPKHSGEANKGSVSLTYLIRKMAHFYNFAVLGLLLGADREATKDSSWVSIIFALLGLLAAVLDESHQYFVPGRSMEFNDAAIDFSGILFGMCFTKIAFWFIFDRRSNGRQEDY